MSATAFKMEIFPYQLGILPLQPFDLGRLLTGDAGALALVDLVLAAQQRKVSEVETPTTSATWTIAGQSHS